MSAIRTKIAQAVMPLVNHMLYCSNSRQDISAA